MRNCKQVLVLSWVTGKYTVCFFYWSALKMTKCKTLRKF